jgi:hypothetical protein
MTTPDVPSTGSGVESPASPSTASPADGAEDPRRRAVRLRHRRRLLAWGAVPALLASVISIWLGFVFLMTLAANRSVIAQDYPAAVSRYETVARVNPWLDKWRVHYNLGTARLLADDTDGAVDELEEALTSAPSAGMIDAQGQDGTTTQVRDPQAPECLVRVNLYMTHLARAQKATDAGDEGSARAAEDEAMAAAGECEVPPPQNSQDPSASPSTDPSATPSEDPSASSGTDPSATPSEDPSATPSGSAEPSSEPTSDESADSTPSDSPTDDSSSTPSSSSSPSPASASPSPADPQRDKLQDRNDRANGTGNKGGNGRKW